MLQQLHQKVIQQTEGMGNDVTTTGATIIKASEVTNHYFNSLLYLFTSLTNLLTFSSF